LNRGGILRGQDLEPSLDSHGKQEVLLGDRATGLDAKVLGLGGLAQESEVDIRTQVCSSWGGQRVLELVGLNGPKGVCCGLVFAIVNEQRRPTRLAYSLGDVGGGGPRVR